MLAGVRGGFWETNGVAVLATIHTTRGLRRLAATALSRKQNLYFREMMRALNGVAPGALASKTLARVVAAEELGGQRPIEQEVLVNSNTSAAQRDLITNNILSRSTKTTFGNNPPANLDGNPLGTR